MRILVAEDDRDMNAILVSRLKKETLQCRYLFSGRRGAGLSGRCRI